jgi:PadR family transcriptional regulator, regulatory protein PadR
MDLRGHLDLMLLATLGHTGPTHGYALIAALRDRSANAFDLPEGTVYPALHRLERAGLVASRWAADSPRRRRVYELTPEGERALAGKQAEWRRFAAGMAAVLAPVQRLQWSV